MVKKRRYTRDFKEHAVQLARSSERGLMRIASDLGVPPSTLHDWLEEVLAAEKKPSPAADSGPLSHAEREELKRLRRETERLQEERAFLKKAAAFFAKENQ